MYKQKNLSWNARPFGPILCFQIQIGDRDCIPTPGMQIQIGRLLMVSELASVTKLTLRELKRWSFGGRFWPSVTSECCCVTGTTEERGCAGVRAGPSQTVINRTIGYGEMRQYGVDSAREKYKWTPAEYKYTTECGRPRESTCMYITGSNV